MGECVRSMIDQFGMWGAHPNWVKPHWNNALFIPCLIALKRNVVYEIKSTITFLSFSFFIVPGAESHGDASLQRAWWRGARLRIGTQVSRTGADAFPGQEALQRGDTAGTGADRVPISKGFAGCCRLSHQSHEVEMQIIYKLNLSTIKLEGRQQLMLVKSANMVENENQVEICKKKTSKS